MAAILNVGRYIIFPPLKRSFQRAEIIPGTKRAQKFSPIVYNLY
jgi:hypothetical protein